MCSWSSAPWAAGASASRTCTTWREPPGATPHPILHPISFRIPRLELSFIVLSFCGVGSIWTVDLAYLLRRFSLDVCFLTVTLGANPGFALETFYKVRPLLPPQRPATTAGRDRVHTCGVQETMDEDEKRVNLLFAGAHRKGIGIQVGGGRSWQRLPLRQLITSSSFSPFLLISFFHFFIFSFFHFFIFSFFHFFIFSFVLSAAVRGWRGASALHPVPPLPRHSAGGQAEAQVPTPPPPGWPHPLAVESHGRGWSVGRLVGWSVGHAVTRGRTGRV